MTIFGYARVSADDRPLSRQVARLKAAGCETIFEEQAGSGPAGRAELSRLLQTVGTRDVVIVAGLDRLASSTRDLLTIFDALSARGAGFRSLGEPWADTTGPGGEALRTIFAGLAAFERDVIRVRTGAGRERAKARGVHVGRPSKLTAQQWREAEADLASGLATQADLARRFDVSESTISRRVSRFSPAPVAVQRTLDADTRGAVQAFLQRIEGRYPLKDAFLFGSRARGTHNPDSDADVAVILKGEKGNRSEIGSDLSNVAYDVMLQTGVLIGALPLWEDEFGKPETFTNPELIRNIKREGVRL